MGAIAREVADAVVIKIEGTVRMLVAVVFAPMGALGI